MQKLNIKDTQEYLYVGNLDFPNDNHNISLEVDNIVYFNVKDTITANNFVINNLSVSDLKKICKECSIKAIIFPNGNFGLRKLDSSDDELKTCYLTFVESSQKKYLICIACDEVQPMLYKAQLINIFSI